MLQVYACMIKENDVRPGLKLQKIYIKKNYKLVFTWKQRRFNKRIITVTNNNRNRR